VVLSAGAILSAGNAVVLAQLLGNAERPSDWMLILLSVGIAGSVSLIVLAVIRATEVLVSLRLTRDLFSDKDFPPGIFFNASDTVRHIGSYSELRSSMKASTNADILDWALVELWIVVRQHRYRYSKLRAAVRALRRAAIVFLVGLIALMTVDLILKF
jgi:hypothetical protein